MPALRGDWRVVRHDLYGHGESGPAPEDATLSTYAAQVVELMDMLGIARAAVVGFSIGGMIGQRLALDRPDRLSALAILNAPHDRGPEAQAVVEARAARVRDEGPMATLPAALERWFTPGYRAARPEVMDRVRDWRARVEPGSYARAAWVLAAGVRELVAPDRPVAVPTLVMTCEDDSGSTPEMSRAIARGIPGAEVRILPGLRHLGLMEEPDAFATPVTAFLAERCR